MLIREKEDACITRARASFLLITHLIYHSFQSRPRVEEQAGIWSETGKTRGNVKVLCVESPENIMNKTNSKNTFQLVGADFLGRLGFWL